MISDFSDIISLFRELDEVLKGNADVFLIGGGALMKYDLKYETKDVDIVVSTEKEFRSLVRAFISLGFEKRRPDDAAYDRMALTDMLIKDDYRIDLFCKAVCGKFTLSERMRGRASLDLSLSGLRLFVCSPNDIFLFKCMTERKGDLQDCEKVVKSYRMDWDAVLNEAAEQSADEHGMWIRWMTDRMEALCDRGVNIPIMDKMRKLFDEYMDERSIEAEKRNSDI